MTTARVRPRRPRPPEADRTAEQFRALAGLLAEVKEPNLLSLSALVGVLVYRGVPDDSIEEALGDRSLCWQQLFILSEADAETRLDVLSGRKTLNDVDEEWMDENEPGWRDGHAKPRTPAKRKPRARRAKKRAA